VQISLYQAVDYGSRHPDLSLYNASICKPQNSTRFIIGEHIAANPTFYDQFPGEAQISDNFGVPGNQCMGRPTSKICF
jgi:hypothetical protein